MNCNCITEVVSRRASAHPSHAVVLTSRGVSVDSRTFERRAHAVSCFFSASLPAALLPFSDRSVMNDRSTYSLPKSTCCRSRRADDRRGEQTPFYDCPSLSS
jgi:hypothetical protein